MWSLRLRRHWIKSENASYTRKRRRRFMSLKVNFVSLEQCIHYTEDHHRNLVLPTQLSSQSPAIVYSTVPSRSSLPLRTFSPFAFNRSSIVRTLPSCVLSLNQPRWSAIKCLMVERSESPFCWGMMKSFKKITYLFYHPGHCTSTTPFWNARFVNKKIDESSVHHSRRRYK